jgi:hypothetical protein
MVVEEKRQDHDAQVNCCLHQVSIVAPVKVLHVLIVGMIGRFGETGHGILKDQSRILVPQVIAPMLAPHGPGLIPIGPWIARVVILIDGHGRAVVLVTLNLVGFYCGNKIVACHRFDSSNLAGAIAQGNKGRGDAALN